MNNEATSIERIKSYNHLGEDSHIWFRIVEPEELGALCFRVLSYDKGFAILKFPRASLPNIAKVISGCFAEGSNFKTKVCEAYDCEVDTFKGIEVSWANVTKRFTEPQSPEEILESLKKKG